PTLPSVSQWPRAAPAWPRRPPPAPGRQGARRPAAGARGVFAPGTEHRPAAPSLRVPPRGRSVAGAGGAAAGAVGAHLVPGAADVHAAPARVVGGGAVVEDPAALGRAADLQPGPAPGGLRGGQGRQDRAGQRADRVRRGDRVHQGAVLLPAGGAEQVGRCGGEPPARPGVALQVAPDGLAHLGQHAQAGPVQGVGGRGVPVVAQPGAGRGDVGEGVLSVEEARGVAEGLDGFQVLRRGRSIVGHAGKFTSLPCMVVTPLVTVISMQAVTKNFADMGGTLNVRFTSSHGEVAWGRMGGRSPVVLLHGTPFSSLVWRETAEALSALHTVYLWDMPGYGLSEKHEGQDVSLPAQQRVLTELLEHWGLEAPAVVAHDIGGAVALRAALLGGVRYRRLALVGVVALHPGGSPFYRLVQKHSEVRGALPPQMHEAAVGAYIDGGAHLSLRAELREALIRPWTGAEGQAA